MILTVTSTGILKMCRKLAKIHEMYEKNHMLNNMFYL